MIYLPIIGIYKIENLKNGKIYIGQSINIQKRFNEHQRNGYYENSQLIDSAIFDVGIENFSFEIIEECSLSELNDKEKYYIMYYNSIYPNGYNKTNGGSSNFQMFLNYSPDVLKNIIIDIKDNILSFKEIAEKYNLDLSMIYYLNRGDYHYQENENYPLREVQNVSKQYHYCIDCGKEISKQAIRCSDCAHKKQKKCERPPREVLKDMIRSMPFTKIGKEFGVSDNAIRKWCKDMNLPSRTKDIKNFSDKDWAKI